jgi:hypothetical protein
MTLGLEANRWGDTVASEYSDATGAQEAAAGLFSPRRVGTTLASTSERGGSPSPASKAMPEEEKLFATDFDGPWKDALDLAPGLFLKRFASAIAADIDWREDHQSLDDELRQVHGQDEEGIRRVDRLLLFKTLSEDLLYLHIEVQCFYDAGLGRRVMTYRHRLRGRYGQPVVTLVILGDGRRRWRPKKHHEGKYGSADSCTWIPIKLLDLSQNLGDLESDENVFALFVAAHLETMMTRRDLTARQQAKLRVLSSLQMRKLEPAEGREWYRLIDWLMKLPAELNEQVYETLVRQHTEEPMKYVSFAEQKGIEKGELLGQIRLCQELLKQPPTPQAELLALTPETLSALLGQLRQQLLPNGD